MVNLEARAKRREELVKLAKKSIVDRCKSLYVNLFRPQLENLKEGEQVPADVPVGKKKFEDWCKKVFDQFYYKEMNEVLDNPEALKTFVYQIADAIGKSSTELQNPIRDYEPVKDQIFQRAGVYTKVKKKAQYMTEQNDTPAESRVKNIYDAPTEHSRYCPDHPGAMLKRVSDKVYQCPIGGELNTVEPWKQQYSYAGGHEVRFETGVQNQTHPGWNNYHPVLPFLADPKESEVYNPKGKEYGYEREKLYGVENHWDNVPPKVKQDGWSDKEAAILNKITRVAEDKKHDCGCGDPDHECKCGPTCSCGPDCGCGYPYKEEKEASVKTAQYNEEFFGPTTMPTRQCPDHPGQQTSRVTDGVRQCPLDGKVYDFNTGFKTEDGTFHPGGSVQAQNSLPPGSVIIKKEAQANDTVHAFLYKHVLPYLPAEAAYARRVLDYKFSKPGMSLEQSLMDIAKADELAKAEKAANNTLLRRITAQENPYMRWPEGKLERELDILESKGALSAEEQQKLTLINEALDAKAEQFTTREEQAVEQEQAAAAKQEKLRAKERAQKAAKKYDDIMQLSEIDYPEWYRRVTTNYPITQVNADTWQVESKAVEYKEEKVWQFETEEEAKEKALQLIRWREYEAFERGGTGTTKKPPREILEVA